MLQTTKKNEVATIKLVSGEEIIGYFISKDANVTTLRKPVVPVPTGNGSMGLAPFIMSSDYLHDGDGEVEFNNATVISQVVTGKQFKDAYTKQVSGLDLSTPPRPSLIT